MTGYHTGHAQVRNNKQVGGDEGWVLGATTGGQWPLAEGTFTVGHLFQKAGYVTGAFGKWGLGRVGTTGDPQKQGFNHFFGYICQRQAHTYYPNHLWRDGQILWIEENKDGAEKVYSHDLITRGSTPVRPVEPEQAVLSVCAVHHSARGAASAGGFCRRIQGPMARSAL